MFKNGLKVISSRSLFIDPDLVRFKLNYCCLNICLATHVRIAKPLFPTLIFWGLFKFVVKGRL